MSLSIPPGGAVGKTCDEALRHAHGHRAELEASASCGCFYCMKLFEFSAIAKWTDGNQTARCPKCSMDAVLGDASGYPITDKFLRRMHRQWYTITPPR